MQESFDAVYKELRSALWTSNGSTDGLSDIANRLKKAHEAELGDSKLPDEGITKELRKSVYPTMTQSAFDGMSVTNALDYTISASLFNSLCDGIDAAYQRVHQKVLNQRKQLGEVQDAIHRRNEGELKTQWLKELKKLEHENSELKKGLTRGHLKLPVDMNGIPCLVGDRMIVRHGLYRDNRFTVVGIGRDDSLIAMNSKGEATTLKAIDCAHIVFSTTSDVIEDAMRWVRTNDYGTSSCEWADMLSASAERIDAINEGRNQ